jgi:hypothetical protein
LRETGKQLVRQIAVPTKITPIDDRRQASERLRETERQPKERLRETERQLSERLRETERQASERLRETASQSQALSASLKGLLSASGKPRQQAIRALLLECSDHLFGQTRRGIGHASRFSGQQLAAVGVANQGAKPPLIAL